MIYVKAARGRPMPIAIQKIQLKDMVFKQYKVANCGECSEIMLQGFFPPFSLIVLRPCGEMATNFTQPKGTKTTFTRF
jgi:hypothetical protein